MKSFTFKPVDRGPAVLTIATDQDYHDSYLITFITSRLKNCDSCFILLYMYFGR